MTELPDRALLVEGHHLLAASLQAALRAEGVEVDSLSSSATDTLLGAVREGGYDLVLLDVDGWTSQSEARDLVRALQETGTRVVVLSNGAVAEQGLAEHDVAGVIDKGRDFASLLTTLLHMPRKPS